MVWRVPEELERSRQDRWRAGFIWAVFGFLVVVALGAQSLVPRALGVELGARVQNGPLSVQMPAGWDVREGEALTIVAEAGSRASRQTLKASLIPTERQASLVEALASGFDNELDEAELERSARRRKINGHQALLVTLNGVVGRGGREVDVRVVRLAWEPAAGVIAVVSLEDIGSRNTAGELIIQQVARTLRFERQEQP